MTERSVAHELTEAITRTGFYPALVMDVLIDDLSVAGRSVYADPQPGATPESLLRAEEQILDFMVHQETHIDRIDVHRHVTVLVLTAQELHIVHIDDEHQDEGAPHPLVQISAETIPLAAIRTLRANYAHPLAHRHLSGQPLPELMVTLGWTLSQRMDIQPAGCADPECTADHGYTGTAAAEDLMLRITEAADGLPALTQARRFLASLRRTRASVVNGAR